LAWLRSQIAVVPQETFLFSGSLWENIAYASGTVDQGRVMSAADHARVTEFACRLGDGFNTHLGDRGVGLSGGQQQRIAIARALLRDAPIVLLDEPTSGLDLEAEQLVVGALHELMRGRTVVMATHRPALLSLADRIVALEDGTLRETFRSDRLARAVGTPA
jgi:ABC-type multidrug transport system fused ATPase/permease subunit